MYITALSYVLACSISTGISKPFMYNDLEIEMKERLEMHRVWEEKWRWDADFVLLDPAEYIYATCWREPKENLICTAWWLPE